MLQTWDILPSYHYIFKGTGSFFNPAILSIFLVTALLAGIYIYDGKLKLSTKLLIAGGLSLLTTCIFLLNSRAAVLALSAGVMWLLTTRYKSRIKSTLSAGSGKKNRIIGCLLLFTLFAVIIYFSIVGLYHIRPDSIHGRILIWQVALDIFLKAPWYGNGLLQSLYMPAQAAWFAHHPGSELAGVAGNNIYAFNEFLRIVCESGIIGLILFIAPVIFVLYYSFKGSKASRYAGAILLSMLYFGIFSYPLSIEVMVMIDIIFFAITANDCIKSHQWSWRPVVPVKYLIATFVLCIVFISGKEYIRVKKADRLLAEAQHTPAIMSGMAIKSYYVHLHGNPDFTHCYGKTLFNNGLYSEALPILEQGYKLKPSSELVCDLGVCYQQCQRYHSAEQAFRLAADMVPAYIIPRYRLLKLYQETGNLEKARETARQIVTMNVKVVNTSVLRIRSQAKIFLNSISK